MHLHKIYIEKLKHLIIVFKYDEEYPIKVLKDLYTQLKNIKNIKIDQECISIIAKIIKITNIRSFKFLKVREKSKNLNYSSIENAIINNIKIEICIIHFENNTALFSLDLLSRKRKFQLDNFRRNKRQRLA
jgi:hypothetical protein